MSRGRSLVEALLARLHTCPACAKPGWHVISGRDMFHDMWTCQIRRTSPPSPLPLDKGKLNGACNRTACLAPGADWWNMGSRAYYCRACARMINEDGCRRYGDPDLCHPTKAGNERQTNPEE